MERGLALILALVIALVVSKSLLYQSLWTVVVFVGSYIGLIFVYQVLVPTSFVLDDNGITFKVLGTH